VGNHFLERSPHSRPVEVDLQRMAGTERLDRLIHGSGPRAIFASGFMWAKTTMHGRNARMEGGLDEAGGGRSECAMTSTARWRAQAWNPSAKICDNHPKAPSTEPKPGAGLRYRAEKHGRCRPLESLYPPAPKGDPSAQRRCVNPNARSTPKPARRSFHRSLHMPGRTATKI